MKSNLRGAFSDEPWNEEELSILAGLTSPDKIQAFLDNLPYSADPFYRSPRSVMRDRKAHCFDGATFAAAALRRLGHPPLIVDMLAERDDDHILAIFKRQGHWGAVAKSNFVGLRFREPIHRTLRELVLSYFESYYNVDREKTLRSYTRSLNLAGFDEIQWMTCDDNLERIAERLDKLKSIPLISQEMARGLIPVDDRTYSAGLSGANEAGLYRPAHKH
jgi:hypothetical protein